MKTITIVGSGRAGGALAIALDRVGYNVEGLISRNPFGSNVSTIEHWLSSETKVTVPYDETPITSDVVIVAVPDPYIVDTADVITKRVSDKSTVLHISGSQPSLVLADKFEDSVSIGSMHPLVSLSDSVTGSRAFLGSYFCLEGDKIAVEIGKEIAHSLGGIPFNIEPSSKSLYHAAAVMSAGHVVALFDIACEVLSRASISGPSPSEILIPLLESVVQNLRNKPASKALTGSFARGDIETIERHLEALDRENLTEALNLYRLLGKHSTLLARQSGLSESVCHDILKTLNLDNGPGE